MESLVYKISDYLSQENFLKFSSEPEQSELKSLASETDDWLYSPESSSADFLEFNKRHDKMDKLIQKVFYRAAESLDRASATKSLIKTLTEYRTKTEEMEKTHPWIAQENK